MGLQRFAASFWVHLRVAAACLYVECRWSGKPLR